VSSSFTAESLATIWEPGDGLCQRDDSMGRLLFFIVATYLPEFWSHSDAALESMAEGLDGFI
jgi:hypothetical protein